MANVQIPDALLVKNYVAGDESALATLITRHQSKIYGFIYSKISDADISNDIFRDTFIKVIKTLKSESYNEEGKFLSWVMRIAHNLVIDHFRRNKKMPTVRSNEEHVVCGTIAHTGKNAEQRVVNVQIDEDVRRLIEHLPEEQREVVIMRTYLGMSFKEI